MGAKFSTFMVAYAKELFGLISMNPKLTSTEDSITISI
jgi:hypothetical protein